MTTLLVIKQNIKNILARYEIYLQPLGKFLLAFITLSFINSVTGYMARLNSGAIVLVVALMCSFMPPNFTIVVAAGFIVAHLYVVSLEAAVVVLAVFLLLFLLFFRFSPRDTIVILLAPLCFYFRIPYLVPLALGLLSTPLSAISAACSVAVYYMVSHIVENATALAGMEADDMAVRFRFIIDGIFSNRMMVVMIAAFVVTIIVTYIIRRLPIDHCWTIAAVTGALVNIIVLLLGDLIWDTTVSVPGAILGTAVSIGIVKVIEFFFFHVDYNRAENVQFEDDEYYYYVRALPKITIAEPARTVKKINAPLGKESADDLDISPSRRASGERPAARQPAPKGKRPPRKRQ